MSAFIALFLHTPQPVVDVLILEILKYSGIVVVSWVHTWFMLYWTGNTRVMVRKTMTQAGSKQQPVVGEAQSGWIPILSGTGCWKTTRRERRKAEGLSYQAHRREST